MRSHLASNLLAVTLYSVPEAGMEARIALQAALTDLLHYDAEAGTSRTHRFIGILQHSSASRSIPDSSLQSWASQVAERQTNFERQVALELRERLP